jgi:hypothetical protein
MSTAVHRDLSWFRDVVFAAPPLDLRSPSVARWSTGSADLEIYTDACLKSDRGDGGRSGLGFHFAKRGISFGFFARLQKKDTDIFFCEALAILLGIEYVARELRDSTKCLIIYSDSAICTYSFNSGAARGRANGPVFRAFDILRSHDIDARVFHLAGTLNVLADDLSRRSPSELRRRHPLAVIAPLEPPGLELGGRAQ